MNIYLRVETVLQAVDQETVTASIVLAEDNQKSTAASDVPSGVPTAALGNGTIASFSFPIRNKSQFGLYVPGEEFELVKIDKSPATKGEVGDGETTRSASDIV